MEKVTSFAVKRVLFAGAIAVAVSLVGTKVLADDSTDIEDFSTNNQTVVYDNTSGDYPVITAIGSQPGVVSGHTYTGWSVFAQDDVGSMDLFLTQSTLTNLTAGAVTSFAVGDEVNVTGQWSPFHALPEMAFSTTVSLSNSIVKVSTGNATPTPPVFTISQLNTAASTTNVPANDGLVGYYLEIQNATISGSTGGFMSTFPTYAQANTVSESYTLTDNSGSVTLFDYVTSYSVDAQLGGTAVPTGPVDVYGFVSLFPSSGLPGGGLPEFTPLAIVSVPEPSTVLLVGTGLLGLLAIRRRRS